MKNFYYLAIIVLFASCAGGKNYMEFRDEEKGLNEAIKRLSKAPRDERALEAIPILYKSIQQTELEKISTWKQSNDIARYDRIINAYNKLQSAYQKIMTNSNAFARVTPTSYAAEILEARQSAAAAYYDYGTDRLKNADSDKAEARKAYTAFNKANQYSPGYKDSKQLAASAYENAIVNVVINPIQDNSFFFNSGWGNYGYNYTNQYFSETLLRDLQHAAERRFAARFFSDQQARSNRIQPDWVVDIILRNLDVPYPQNMTNQIRRSKEIVVGKDTSGKQITQTVYATLHITRSYFTAYADFDLNIRDLTNGRFVTNRNFRENFDWSHETGSYSGDSRALDSYDWQIINNRYRQAPRREDIMAEIYRKLYPQIRNQIEYAVEW